MLKNETKKRKKQEMFFKIEKIRQPNVEGEGQGNIFELLWGHE